MKYIQWLTAIAVLCSFTLAGKLIQPQNVHAGTSESLIPDVTPKNEDSLEAAAPKIPTTTWVTVENGFSQKGNASYYANKFHGRRTSSGAIYHKDSLTAAHKTLKFGTLLRVTNLANDSSVIVKVTDRMGRTPHVIDLSLAGAKKLNFVRNGVAKVKIEEVKQAD